MVTRTAAAVGSALALCASVVLLEACEGILGISGDTYTAEAGPDAHGDAGRDGRRDREVEDAGPGAAVVVASSTLTSGWCVVTQGGDVECWGNNERGELGDGTTQDSQTPVRVKGLPGPASSVSFGAAGPCALTKGGGVYCWGLNDRGELGDGKDGGVSPFSTTAVAVFGLSSGVTSLSTGGAVSCAVRAGAVYCWGSADFGTLGSNRTKDALVPVPVMELGDGVASVSVGLTTACAVRRGAAWCWGAFGDGQTGSLGNGTSKGSYTPVQVSGLDHGVVEVSVGSDFACARTDTGGALCWGDGTYGQLGNGMKQSSPVPVEVSGLKRGVIAVSAGAYSVTAIKEGGTVVAWGYGADGELGNGPVPDAGSPSASGYLIATPVEVKGLSEPAVTVSTGQAPCVVTLSGKVHCWGLVGETALTPVQVAPLGPAISVSVGGDFPTGAFACAVSSAGAIWCWGANAAGQLGDKSGTSSTRPVENASLANSSTQVSAGWSTNYACAINSGAVYCWGENESGQLGIAPSGPSQSAQAVQLPPAAVGVSTGAFSACAIVPVSDAGSGGDVYCWGDNSAGQLGDHGNLPSYKPVKVVGLPGPAKVISVGLYHACAVLTDGELYCWGANDTGQLGDGTMTERDVAIPVLTGASDVSAGFSGTCAVANGNVYCWGGNDSFQLGTGDNVASLLPVQVGISGTATAVSMGAVSACAIVSGAALCWGSGALGNDGPPLLARPTPQPVTGLGSGVSSIAVTENLSCAVVNGNVKCWGLNTAGQLGNGGATSEYRPIAIAGFP